MILALRSCFSQIPELVFWFQIPRCQIPELVFLVSSFEVQDSFQIHFPLHVRVPADAVVLGHMFPPLCHYEALVIQDRVFRVTLSMRMPISVMVR